MARATKRLSVRTVDTIASSGYHADGDGLYLVVDRSGARRWAFIFHSQGKRREMGLGRMGLKEAREKADEVRRQVRGGLDPILTRRTAACEALPEAFDLRLCGAETPVRLLGLALPLDPGAGR